MADALPLYRPLRVFAFDPGLGRRHGNHMTIPVRFEELKGPVRGALVHVIDYDASNRRYYEPVKLDDRDVLLQDGLAPSESDPRFHQQMAYAVATRTIAHFSAALGRDVTWRRRPMRDPRTGRMRVTDRPLRIFPHAFQDANAYYDPDLHALLFGYFGASADDEVSTSLPGQTVFTCLSHDVVAHETTHALLHDIRHYFLDVTSEDTLAFHEAFADIVALFQHFNVKDALLEHVRRTGGALFRDLQPLAAWDRRDIAAPATDRGGEDERRAGADRRSRPRTLAEVMQRNVLIGLAQQFGEAIGLRAALRSALDEDPSPDELARRREPHARGAILVAAVFDAFFTVYAQRVAPFFRIAGESAWTGNGEIGHELATRLAAEAAKTAGQFLNMCIRALDYCPPVDITFGDYLRALVTADHDLVRDDDMGYREILIDAFRRRGIRPRDVTSQSESALRWQAPETRGGRGIACTGLSFDVIQGNPGEVQSQNARVLNAFAKRHARELHLSPAEPIYPRSFHPVHRVSPDGDLRFQVVVELVQSRRLRQTDFPLEGERPFFRGGTTLVLDAETGRVEYAIYKPVTSRSRRERQLGFWEDWFGAASTAFRPPAATGVRANFALVHRGY